MTRRSETSRLLVVAAEAGAARYLMPLWHKWLTQETSFAWRVILGDGASKLAESEGLLRQLPLLASLDRFSEQVDGILDDWAPTALLASAGDAYPLETACVRHVSRRGGATAQFVDNWDNFARRFRASGGDATPDYIIVIDEQSKADAIAQGLPSDKVLPLGQPWLENVPRWKAGPPSHVFFLGAPVRRDYGRTLGFDEWDAWDTVLAAARRKPHLFEHLWYGKHPEQCDPRLEQLEPGLLVLNSMRILPEAGTVLGMFSAPMIDAYLSGACVISVQPNLTGPDLCHLSRRGAIERVADPEGLVAALERTDRTGCPRTLPNLAGSAERIGRFVVERLVG